THRVPHSFPTRRSSDLAAHNMEEALAGLDYVGLPAIIRPSFTLGGTGGGIAYNRQEFAEIVERGLDASPTTEVLIEESVLGWKEDRKSTRLNSSHVKIS